MLYNKHSVRYWEPPTAVVLKHGHQFPDGPPVEQSTCLRPWTWAGLCDCLNEQNPAEVNLCVCKAPKGETMPLGLLLLGYSLWDPSCSKSSPPTAHRGRETPGALSTEDPSFRLRDGIRLRAQRSHHIHSGMPPWASCCVRKRNPCSRWVFRICKWAHSLLIQAFKRDSVHGNRKMVTTVL